MFLKPVDSGEFPEYYDIIAEPTDFSMIIQRLKNQDYRGCGKWKHDMELISINANMYFGRGSAVAVLADHVHRTFEKEYERMPTVSFAKWMTHVSMLHYRLQFLTQRAPKGIFGQICVASTLIGARARIPWVEEMERMMPMSVPEEEIVVPERKVVKKKRVRENASWVARGAGGSSRKPAKRELSAKELRAKEDLDWLAQALPGLPDADDVRRILYIIVRVQPELKFELPDVVLEMKSLKRKTVHRIVDYTKNDFMN